MKFTWKEMLVKDRLAKTFYNESDIPEDALAYGKIWMERVNIFVAGYAKPGLLNSVYRTDNKTSSHHLMGAGDIQDTDGSFALYCMNNVQLMHRLDLYLESPLFTHTCLPNKTPTSGWVHLDIGRNDGNRKFVPRNDRIYRPF